MHAWDRYLHRVPVSVFGHVMAFHGSPLRGQRAKRFVLEYLPRIQSWLTSDDAFVVDDVSFAIGINNFPVSKQDTNWGLRLVLDANAVDENPATMLRVAVFSGKAWGRLNHDIVRTIGLHRFGVYTEGNGWYVCHR